MAELLYGRPLAITSIARTSNPFSVRAPRRRERLRFEIGTACHFRSASYPVGTHRASSSAVMGANGAVISSAEFGRAP